MKKIQFNHKWIKIILIVLAIAILGLIVKTSIEQKPVNSDETIMKYDTTNYDEFEPIKRMPEPL